MSLQAADEIKERLDRQLGPAATAQITAGTFHSVAARALRSHIARLGGCGRTGDFTIHDQEDGVALLAGWVAEQRKAAAARNGDANTKPVSVADRCATSPRVVSTPRSCLLHRALAGAVWSLRSLMRLTTDWLHHEELQDMKEVRAAAKELQRRISLLKNSLPCAYGFSAEELVYAVMALGTVTGGLHGSVHGDTVSHDWQAVRQQLQCIAEDLWYGLICKATPL